MKSGCRVGSPFVFANDSFTVLLVWVLQANTKRHYILITGRPYRELFGNAKDGWHVLTVLLG